MQPIEGHVTQASREVEYVGFDIEEAIRRCFIALRAQY
jgi:hypothetical protein